MLSFASQPECTLKSKELKKVFFKESGEQTKESALGRIVSANGSFNIRPQILHPRNAAACCT